MVGWGNHGAGPIYFPSGQAVVVPLKSFIQVPNSFYFYCLILQKTGRCHLKEDTINQTSLY